MTSKERMVAAFLNRGEPDCVPVYPGLSTLYPLKNTGRPFWEIEYYDDPSKVDVMIDLVRELGYDGWFSGGLGVSPDDPECSSEVIEQSDAALTVRQTLRTSAGELTQETVYPRSDSRWLRNGWADGVDIEANAELLCCQFVDPWQRSTAEYEETYAKVGGLGIVELYTLTPFDWWAEYMRRSAQDAIFDFFDHPEVMRDLIAAYTDYTVEYVRAGCDRLKPDMVQFQGTSSSMSILSPDMFREINLPYIERAAAVCREYDIPTYVHSGGKSVEMVKLLADSGISAIGPVEGPPMGDNNLAELKRLYGDKLCFQGNVDTIKVMREGTPGDVRTAVRTCIEAAAPGGGYILGTGDQTPYDAPEANVIAFIEAGREFGQYPALTGA